MYIRTKDGVYKVSHLNAYATHKRKGETLLEGYKTAYIKNENIIKQSENLEELCDEFVGFEDGCIPFVWRFDTIDKYRERDLFIKEILENKGTEEIIYGAIWTSKGLIYVAKMNEKGELELLQYYSRLCRKNA